MIREQRYIKQTEKMIGKYFVKEGMVRDYILICHEYVSELRNLDANLVFDELTYSKLLEEVLFLVSDNFKSGHFRSYFSDETIRVLDEEFMVYIISVKFSFKKQIKWEMLCDLQYKFSILKINFEVSTNFQEDFTQYAIKNLTLSELWTASIN